MEDLESNKGTAHKKEAFNWSDRNILVLIFETGAEGKIIPRNPQCISILGGGGYGDFRKSWMTIIC